MSTAPAAYCSACNRYVYIAENGGCEFGHPRSSLRAIYVADIERKTGRPKPPSRQTKSPVASQLMASVATRAEQVAAALEARATAAGTRPFATVEPAALGPALEPATPKPTTPGLAALEPTIPTPAAPEPATVGSRATSSANMPMPMKEPRAPMIFDVAGAAIWPSDFMGLSGLSRLLNPPRGKHSAPPHTSKLPRGRHSTGANRGAGETTP